MYFLFQIAVLEVHNKYDRYSTVIEQSPESDTFFVFLVRLIIDHFYHLLNYDHILLFLENAQLFWNYSLCFDSIEVPIIPEIIPA